MQKRIGSVDPCRAVPKFMYINCLNPQLAAHKSVTAKRIQKLKLQVWPHHHPHVVIDVPVSFLHRLAAPGTPLRQVRLLAGHLLSLLLHQLLSLSACAKHLCGIASLSDAILGSFSVRSWLTQKKVLET